MWLILKKKKFKELIKMSAQQTSSAANKLTLPDSKSLSQACKLAIKLSKPIDFYFYVDSCRGGCQIISNDGEKILYKNNDEHTSPIKNTYGVGNEFLVVTENTIYILSKNTQIKS